MRQQGRQQHDRQQGKKGPMQINGNSTNTRSQRQGTLLIPRTIVRIVVGGSGSSSRCCVVVVCHDDDDDEKKKTTTNRMVETIELVQWLASQTGSSS